MSAGNPATPRAAGPEALRHCLATVLPNATPVQLKRRMTRRALQAVVLDRASNSVAVSTARRRTAESARRSVVAVGMPVRALARRIHVDRDARDGQAGQLRVEAADDERHLLGLRPLLRRRGGHLDL